MYIGYRVTIPEVLMQVHSCSIEITLQVITGCFTFTEYTDYMREGRHVSTDNKQLSAIQYVKCLSTTPQTHS
jgi:homoserine dehydrogenase